MLRTPWYSQKWYHNPLIRIPKYFKSIIGIIRYSCTWERTDSYVWVNDDRKPWRGKWKDRPWHVKTKCWYIGFQRKPKPPIIKNGGAEGFEEINGYIVSYIPPFRRNKFSNFLNWCTDKVVSIRKLPY